KFADRDGKLNYVWATSWGVSTRLMGALVMTHSDDKGLVLPPTLAPIQVVIIPMIKSEESKNKIEELSDKIFNDLKSDGVRVKIDSRENFTLGYKLNDYELKGIPIRLVIGEQEIENDEYEIFSRDDFNKLKSNSNDILNNIIKSLDDVQDRMLSKAKKRLNDNTHEVSSYDKFKEIIESQSGFVSCGWDGNANTEESIKKETKATIRCIVGNGEDKDLKCIYSGKPAKHKVIFAKSY
ncbi:MAG: proline--tRNA ligase, partial [Flavobacteriaceae bacterium]|nr:proline--tRNA ligase [Flavobacteriaceae bacterium]